MREHVVKPGEKLVNGLNVILHKDGRKEVVTHFDHDVEPSLTQQQFRDDCDVNKIMEKFMKTGEISHLARSQGVYADLVGIGDYQDMLLRVKQAEEAFDTLPIKVKEKFGQNPGALISFLEDPANRQEALDLGLLEAPPRDPTLELLNQINENLKPAAPSAAEPKKGTP